MANAMVALGNLTLSSGQSSVTFGNIPSTYRDLYIVCVTANSGTASASRLRFNGDTGGNYNSVGIGAQGSTVSSWNEFSVTGGRILGYSVGPTTGRAIFTMSVMDYAQTDKHKTALSRFSDAGADVMSTATRWASLSAITSVTIYDVLGQTFVAGSSFSIYGVVA